MNIFRKCRIIRKEEKTLSNDAAKEERFLLALQSKTTFTKDVVVEDSSEWMCAIKSEMKSGQKNILKILKEHEDVKQLLKDQVCSNIIISMF